MKHYGPDVPMLSFAIDRLKERVQWKASGRPTKRDFLERCLKTQAKNVNVVTDRMVVLYNFNNVRAGADTTAVAINSINITHSFPAASYFFVSVAPNVSGYIMYYLLKNPAMMSKLVQEIDDADKQGRLSEYAKWQEASKLVYFQACIKEALRESIPSTGSRLDRIDTGVILRNASPHPHDPRALRAQRRQNHGKALLPRRHHRRRQSMAHCVSQT
jgi:hypothetical protein